jgi:deoxyribonuclease-4
MPVAAHASYLVNVCSEDGEVRRKSWDLLADELARCEALGIAWLVFHPGSHPHEREGLKLAAEGMAQGLERVGGEVRLLMETTAGQGSCLGWRFEQLAALRDALPAAARERVGVCFDTCHVHAAGYDLASPEGYEATFAALDRAVGLDLVEAFHLNDSKKERGSRVDRHEHIGDGALGLEPFRALVNDPRFASVPAFLETDQRFRENLALLHSLRS